MKTPLLTLVTFVALLLSVPVARADEAADKTQINELEKTCAAALVKGDYQTAGEIFADDWKIVDAAGQVTSRQDIFKELTSGDLKFNSYEIADLDVHVVGDTAVVIGHGHSRGSFKGETFEAKEVFTDTFVRIGGKWRCLLTHSTDLNEDK